MSLNTPSNNGQNGSMMSSNPVRTFALAKAERLATAVHMITRFMDAREPLRHDLRRESLQLLSRIFVLDERGGDTSETIISRVVSLLDIAYRTQIISEMNWQVIRSEYVAFSEFLEERNLRATHDTETITPGFFDVLKPDALKAPQPQKTAGLSTQEVQKDKTITKGQVRKSPPKPTRSPVIKERKNGRRDAILKLIRERKKVGVRDVAEVVTGVSEKTLQRELISLVAEGVLKKEGERRWSTYSLAR